MQVVVGAFEKTRKKKPGRCQKRWTAWLLSWNSLLINHSSSLCVNNPNMQNASQTQEQGNPGPGTPAEAWLTGTSVRGGGGGRES